MDIKGHETEFLKSRFLSSAIPPALPVPVLPTSALPGLPVPLSPSSTLPLPVLPISSISSASSPHVRSSYPFTASPSNHATSTLPIPTSGLSVLASPALPIPTASLPKVTAVPTDPTAVLYKNVEEAIHILQYIANLLLNIPLGELESVSIGSTMIPYLLNKVGGPVIVPEIYKDY